MFSWLKKGKNPEPPSGPVIHEPLQWNKEGEKDYLEWCASLEKKRLLNHLLDAYLVFERRGETLDDAIDLSDNRMHRGFVLYAATLSYPFETYRFLLEYLKDRMLDAGYVLSLNDAMTGQEKGQWKTVYRYFLRPSVSLRQSEPRRQLFGNVKIELHVLDDRVHHLQCLSTIYSDRSYEAPLPFRELIELLLLQKGN